ncbi:MAG: hypothetical protein Q4F25_03665 [Eubacteriales bacterium]|nr:hypothetical protein [Eubacteriales bacterium]
MQFRRTPKAGGSPTDFYLTDERDGGMRDAQQQYAADLVMEYRRRFGSLRITAVWDFGREEADPFEGPKYGRFADSKVNAVYNAQMLTISLNHARLRLLPCEADPGEIRRVLAEYDRQRHCVEKAAQLETELLSGGLPWPQIGGRLKELLGIRSCRGNDMGIRDPYFADVQGIRMLEDTQSIERILVHEIGHMLFEESGAVRDKRLRKLFGTCRDGFEDLYEFCAECFMAGEMIRRSRRGDVRETAPEDACALRQDTDGILIPLAEEVRGILEKYL